MTGRITLKDMMPLTPILKVKFLTYGELILWDLFQFSLATNSLW